MERVRNANGTRSERVWNAFGTRSERVRNAFWTRSGRVRNVYLTNHSLRATTVTVLSGSNIETRQIKAVAGHKSDCSIESYCERPTLSQFREMSTALTLFIHSDRSPESRSQSFDLSKEKHGHSATILNPISRTSTHLSCQNSQTTEHESFLTSLGLNSGSILQSGSFNNCQFTFTVNMSTR